MKFKGKLILPVLAIIAALTAGIGSTYALFSGSDETNIAVTSGEVNVSASIDNLDLYSPKLIGLDGKIVDDTNVATSTHFYNGGTANVLNDVLLLSNITPGDKVSFKINIHNNSNIAIKYHVLYEDATQYTGEEEHKLIDVLNVKKGDSNIIAGDPIVFWTETKESEIDPLSISVELPSDVANKYLGLSVKLRFAVEAVQANAFVEDSAITVSFEGNMTSIDKSYFKLSKREHKIDFLFKNIESTITITIEEGTSNRSIVCFEYPEGGNVTLKKGTEQLEYFDSSSPDKTFPYYVEDDTTFTFNGECCVLKGTPITMADYSYKNVEDLIPGDNILAYDFFEGKFVSKEINYTFDETFYAPTFEVILDNGKSVVIANSEDMFDTNMKKFFTISSQTYEDAIGRNILVNNSGENEIARIVDVKYKCEEVTYYTLYSKGLMNYVANDVLMIYSNSGFNEKYTITDDLRIDMNIYNSDVEKYGLFTYEDFPMFTKEMFDDFDIATTKFLLGKGCLTKEEFDEYNRQFIEEYHCKKPLFLAKC